MSGRSIAVAVLSLMLVGLQWRLWVADGGLSHVHRLQREVSAFAQQNDRLRERNAALDAEVRDLGSGTDAIEARARTTLGMVKEGETFYLVVQR